MSEVYHIVLEALDKALGEGVLANHLPGAQAALPALRKAYYEHGDPRYETEYERLAYALAFHPAHISMGDWAFEQVGSTLAYLRECEAAHVVILGAGAGAELVALARYLSGERSRIRLLKVTLVDRQPSWEVLRGSIGVSLARQYLDPCTLEATSLCIDLLCTTDRPRLQTVLENADLVIAHAILSEIASTDSGGETIDWLCSSVPSGVPLLLVDLNYSSGGKKALERCGEAGLKVYGNASASVPIGRPPERLKETFFREDDGLWPRGKVHAQMQLLARGSPPINAAKPQFSLTPDQERTRGHFTDFLSARGTHPVAVLRGAAGTGKSTLIGEFVRLALAGDREPVLMAPTGQASKRLHAATDCPAQTLHSALYRHHRTDYDNRGGRAVRFVPTDALGGDLWIVDEASLIGDKALTCSEDAVRLQFHEGELLTDLLDARAREGEGTQIVFVGDHYQLPPVGGGEHSPALDPATLSDRLGVDVPLWELETVTRQAANSPVLQIATQCRLGEALSEVPSVSSITADRLADHTRAFEHGSTMVIAWANATVAGFNRTIRALLGRPSSLPEPTDRLVTIRTTADRHFVNGDEMIVESIGARREVSRQLGNTDESVVAHLIELVVSVEAPHGRVPLEVLVLLDGIEGHTSAEIDKIERVLLIDARARFREALKGRSELTEEAFLSTDPIFNALRVAYPYARTCHRAQGGEWDSVIVDLSHARRPPKGWDYTAITRACRRLSVVNRPPQHQELNIALALEPVLAEQGLRGRFQALQHGAQQVVVSDEQASVQINVYVRRGQLSTIDLQKGDEWLAERVMPLLRRWAARVREARQPIVNADVTGRLDAVLMHVDLDAVQVTRYRIGDWEGKIEAIDACGGVAELRFGYDSTGNLRRFVADGVGAARGEIDAIHDQLDPPLDRTGTV